MRLRQTTLGLAVLGVALSARAEPTRAAPPAQETPSRGFTLDQPPIAWPLDLVTANGTRVRARIDLSSMVETLEIQSGRKVHVLANHGVPALIALPHRDPESSRIDFRDASTVAEAHGRALWVRTADVFVLGERVATISIRSEVDLFGLADEIPHVTVRNARVEALDRASGAFSGMALARETVFASPVFPLELVEAKNRLTLEAREGALVGTITLADRMSPAALRTEEEAQIGLHTYDARGTLHGRWVVPLDVGCGVPSATKARASESWAPAAGATRPATATPADTPFDREPSVSIIWTWREAERRWTGELEVTGASASGWSRALVTLGNTSSPFSLQAAAMIPSLSRQASLSPLSARASSDYGVSSEEN